MCPSRKRVAPRHFISWVSSPGGIATPNNRTLSVVLGSIQPSVTSAPTHVKPQMMLSDSYIMLEWIHRPAEEPRVVGGSDFPSA